MPETERRQSLGWSGHNRAERSAPDREKPELMQRRILIAVRGKTERSHTLEQRCQGMLQVFPAPQASRCLKLLSSTENTNVSPGARWYMLFSQLVTETLLSKCGGYTGKHDPSIPGSSLSNSKPNKQTRIGFISLTVP